MTIQCIYPREVPTSPGVYAIHCLESGKVYVGRSINLRRRFYEHNSRLRHNKHPNHYLQRAYIKYGPDAFVFDVLSQAIDEAVLAKMEAHFLKLFRCQAPIGFNLEVITSDLVSRPSDETRSKIGKAHRGRRFSAQTLANMSSGQRGRRHSPRTRDKMASSQRDRADNRRYTLNGETLTITDWSKRVGLGVPTINYRLRQGWSVERTLTTPVKKKAA